MAEVNFLIKQGLTVPKGSASTPSIIFDAGDADCGLFSPANNQVAVSVQGSASAPALSFGSDSDTGVYSPGANQLAISTNGTGRLFVRANGDVDLVDNTLILNKTGLGNGQLIFDGSAFSIISNSSGAPLVFGTNSTERARIDSSGRLGLGTSTPMNILHVTAANAAGASANDGARVSAGTSLVGINFGADSTATFGWIQSSEAGVAFAPTVINPQGGNVGIGVTSPGDKLEIGGSGSGIILASPDGTRYKLTVANGGTLSIAAA